MPVRPVERPIACAEHLCTTCGDVGPPWQQSCRPESQSHAYDIGMPAELQHGLMHTQVGSPAAPRMRSPNRDSFPYMKTWASCMQACPDDSVLIFGDGNFSFTRGLIDHDDRLWCDGDVIVATSYDSRHALISKFGDEVLLDMQTFAAFSEHSPCMIPPCSTHSSACLLYTSPSPRDRTRSRMPSSA